MNGTYQLNGIGRLPTTILIGLTVLLASCRSPNGDSAARNANRRLTNFANDFSMLLGREARLSSAISTTGSLIKLDTQPSQKSNQSKYVFWERNFNRLSGVNAGKLAKDVLVGVRVGTQPGSQGLLSSGSLTDPRLRGEHFSHSLKQLFLLEQRFPDVAGWQSVYRD